MCKLMGIFNYQFTQACKLGGKRGIYHHTYSSACTFLGRTFL